MALRAEAQASEFGIRGLGIPGREASAHSLALGGANGLFDAESSLNPAALGTLTTTTSSFTSSGTFRNSTSPSGSLSTRDSRFPQFLIGGPVTHVAAVAWLELLDVHGPRFHRRERWCRVAARRTRDSARHPELSRRHRRHSSRRGVGADAPPLHWRSVSLSHRLEPTRLPSLLGGHELPVAIADGRAVVWGDRCVGRCPVATEDRLRVGGDVPARWQHARAARFDRRRDRARARCDDGPGVAADHDERRCPPRHPEEHVADGRGPRAGTGPPRTPGSWHKVALARATRSKPRPASR